MKTFYLEFLDSRGYESRFYKVEAENEAEAREKAKEAFLSEMVSDITVISKKDCLDASKDLGLDIVEVEE